MEVHISFTCFFLFFFSQQDRKTHLTSAQTVFFFTIIDGENIRMDCPFSSRATQKFFCKEDCKEKDIIIETTDNSAEKGRYSIQTVTSRAFTVSISQVNKSDSGRYRCGVGRFLTTAEYKYIEIIVVDALLEGTRRDTPIDKRSGDSITFACSFPSSSTVNSAFLCKEQCTDKLISTQNQNQRDRYTIRYEEFTRSESVYVTISQLSKSDSGQYQCGVGEKFYTFNVTVTDALTTPDPNKNTITETTKPAADTTEDTVWYVGLIVIGLVVLLAVALLIFCRKRSSKPKETPEETEYASVTATNHVYDELGEKKQRRPSPGEINLGATSQYTAEDVSSKVTYSELIFSNQPAGSLNSDPRGLSDNVIYSVPR